MDYILSFVATFEAHHADRNSFLFLHLFKIDIHSCHREHFFISWDTSQSSASRITKYLHGLKELNLYGSSYMVAPHHSFDVAWWESKWQSVFDRSNTCRNCLESCLNYSVLIMCNELFSRAHWMLLCCRNQPLWSAWISIRPWAVQLSPSATRKLLIFKNVISSLGSSDDSQLCCKSLYCLRVSTHRLFQVNSSVTLII